MCPARSLEPLLRGKYGNVIVHCGAQRTVVIHCTDLCLFGLSWQDQFITAGHVGSAFSISTASTATFPRHERSYASLYLLWLAACFLSCVLYAFFILFILHCLLAVVPLGSSFCACLSLLYGLFSLRSLLYASFSLFIYCISFILFQHFTKNPRLLYTKWHSTYIIKYLIHGGGRDLGLPGQCSL